MKANRAIRAAAAILTAATVLLSVTAGCAGSSGNPGAQSQHSPTSAGPAPTSPGPLSSPAPTTSSPTASGSPSPIASSPRPTAPKPPTTTPPGSQSTLRPGDSGPAVLALQRRLGSLGYDATLVAPRAEVQRLDEFVRLPLDLGPSAAAHPAAQYDRLPGAERVDRHLRLRQVRAELAGPGRIHHQIARSQRDPP
ncbi:MAG TPA: hypothetical protein VFU65_13875 [Actinocrinis sp.]|nr:hypothetical protein [Actinocrinis sp.]